MARWHRRLPASGGLRSYINWSLRKWLATTRFALTSYRRTHLTMLIELAEIWTIIRISTGGYSRILTCLLAVLSVVWWKLYLSVLYDLCNLWFTHSVTNEFACIWCVYSLPRDSKNIGISTIFVFPCPFVSGTKALCRCWYHYRMHQCSVVTVRCIVSMVIGTAVDKRWWTYADKFS